MALIAEVEAATTHEMRRRVLRGGDMTADVDYPEDALPGAFHLGAFNGDDLVGIASFSPTPAPHRDTAAHAWQLRGMAINPAVQGQGIGADLVQSAVDRLRADGADMLWCNARDSAASFYQRLGFLTEGEGFITKTTGLPHHVMVLDL